MNRKTSEILLASVIIARSTSFLLSEAGLQSICPFNLLAVRFLLAFAILAVIFHNRLFGLKPITLLRGAMLGLAFFGVMAAELFGLRTTDSSTTSFLENTAIVIVPIFEALLHHRMPGSGSIVSILMTIGGVACLTLKNGVIRFTVGELLCLVAALMYAIAIILTDRLSHRDEPLTLGILQVGFIGLFGLIASFIFEAPRLPFTGSEWAVIAALAVVGSCFGFTLQPVAQRGTASERASMFCALNPLSAAILGMIFLNERMGVLGIVGAVLILGGITVRSLPDDAFHRQKNCQLGHGV